MQNEHQQTKSVAQGEAVPATASGTVPHTSAAKAGEKAARAGAKPKTRNKPAGSGKKSRSTKKRSRSPAPRSDSKGAKILKMIKRPRGATLAEIMRATSWQAHSVRGFVSTAGARYGVRIASERNEGGDRVYRVKE